MADSLRFGLWYDFRNPPAWKQDPVDVGRNDVLAMDAQLRLLVVHCDEKGITLWLLAGFGDLYETGDQNSNNHSSDSTNHRLMHPFLTLSSMS